MILVVDTSVAVKWFVDEPDRYSARLLLSAEHSLFAPDFLIAEVANVLWRKSRIGDISADQMNQALRDLPRFFQRLSPTEDLVLDALVAARELSHSVYDCLFLVLAGAIPDAVLATADERFLAKVAPSSFAGLVSPLSLLPLHRAP